MVQGGNVREARSSATSIVRLDEGALMRACAVI